MKREEYLAYIQSPEWFEKRKCRLELDNWTCFVCELRPDDCCLNAHHLTYEHIGNEPLDDLITLCIKCHEAIHKRPSYDRKSLQAMKDEFEEQRNTVKWLKENEIEERRRKAEEFLAKQTFLVA